MDKEHTVHGIEHDESFKKEKREDEVRAIYPSNFGWLEKKLSDKEMKYLWKCVDNPKGSKNPEAAGQIHESNVLVDKSDWFWQHTSSIMCRVLPRIW